MKSSEINGSAFVPFMYIQILLMQLHVWHQTDFYLPVLWPIDPRSCAPKEHVACSDFGAKFTGCVNSAAAVQLSCSLTRPHQVLWSENFGVLILCVWVNCLVLTRAFQFQK